MLRFFFLPVFFTFYIVLYRIKCIRLSVLPIYFLVSRWVLSRTNSFWKSWFSDFHFPSPTYTHRHTNPCEVPRFIASLIEYRLFNLAELSIQPTCWRKRKKKQRRQTPQTCLSSPLSTCLASCEISVIFFWLQCSQTPNAFSINVVKSITNAWESVKKPLLLQILGCYGKNLWEVFLITDILDTMCLIKSFLHDRNLYQQ